MNIYGKMVILKLLIIFVGNLRVYVYDNGGVVKVRLYVGFEFEGIWVMICGVNRVLDILVVGNYVKFIVFFII